MINIETFFKNHFDTKEISDDNLRKFSEIHIQRLVANNEGGKYASMITDTTKVHNNYFGSISGEDSEFSIQQSLTKSKDAVFSEFKTTVKQKEGTIRGIWNTNTPTYQEFFPYGIKEYTKATLANVETLMTRMVTASQAHVKELGKPFLDLFVSLKTNFMSTRTSQLGKIGKVKNIKTGTTKTRNALEIQLMSNLLTIAKLYIDDTSKSTVFFDQSFIRVKTNAEEMEAVVETSKSN